MAKVSRGAAIMSFPVTGLRRSGSFSVTVEILSEISRRTGCLFILAISAFAFLEHRGVDHVPRVMTHMQGLTAVYIDVLAGNETAKFRSQENDRASDVLGRPHPV